MTKTRSWLAALNEHAKAQGLSLPRFDFNVGGMGAATSDLVGDRFVTLKRRLDARATPPMRWVQWSLWRGDQDQPEFVASFRTQQEPTDSAVAEASPLILGWLYRGWSIDQARGHVRRHPGAIALPTSEAAPPAHDEYWLSDRREFGFVVSGRSWSIVAKDQTEGYDSELLRRLCEWLVGGWHSVALGGDVRPPEILNDPVIPPGRMPTTADDPELREWWCRHSARSENPELPDLFLERQADDLVVSWKDRVISLPAAVAVPTLRRLVETYCGIQHAGGLLGLPYKTISQFNSMATRDWLGRYEFDDDDALELARTGVSSHPIIGLLRSGQGSTLTTVDYDAVFQFLRPSDGRSYAGLVSVAKGLKKPVNPARPWVSGYELARAVRQRLGLAPSIKIDVDALAQNLGVDVQAVALHDESVLGACVGTPAYQPMAVVSMSCPDARGLSGRRMTLAHEFCHLLFDRGAYRFLSRFEGARAVGDRLIEMRANAFAIELLVPMSNLVGVAEDRLTELAHEWQVSIYALKQHWSNARKGE